MHVYKPCIYALLSHKRYICACMQTPDDVAGDVYDEHPHLSPLTLTPTLTFTLTLTSHLSPLTSHPSPITQVTSSTSTATTTRALHHAHVLELCTCTMHTCTSRK